MFIKEIFQPRALFSQKIACYCLAYEADYSIAFAHMRTSVSFDHYNLTMAWLI